MPAHICGDCLPKQRERNSSTDASPAWSLLRVSWSAASFLATEGRPLPALSTGRAKVVCSFVFNRASYLTLSRNPVPCWQHIFRLPEWKKYPDEHVQRDFGTLERLAPRKNGCAQLHRCQENGPRHTAPVTRPQRETPTTISPLQFRDTPVPRHPGLSGSVLAPGLRVDSRASDLVAASRWRASPARSSCATRRSGSWGTGPPNPRGRYGSRDTGPPNLH